MRRAITTVLLALGLGLPALAQAQLRCTFQGTTPLLFANYNPLQFADSLAQGSFAIRCTGNPNRPSQMQIAIAPGQVGTVSARALQSGPARLGYVLYQDSARSVPWGDGTQGTSILLLDVTGGDQFSLPVYGRVPQRQNVPIGSYGDSVTVQINY